MLLFNLIIRYLVTKRKMYYHYKESINWNKWKAIFSASSVKYRFFVTSAAPKITEMMINFEKSECLERTDKKNEKETIGLHNYQH